MIFCNKLRRAAKGMFVVSLGFVLSATFPAIVHAQTVPNTAEVDRIKPKKFEGTTEFKKPDRQIPVVKSYQVNAPESAKSVKLLFKGIKVEGSTVFTPEELLETYSEYLDKNAELSIAWIIAARITEKYTNDGYFLSRAYIPEQEVKDGVITIHVIEGYIGEIELEDTSKNNRVINSLSNSFSSLRPVKINQVESFLLRLNDLPGQKFKGVLSNLESNDDAAAKLTLVTLDSKSSEGSINIDNYGSRYIGPTQLSASYGASFAPLHQTNFSASSNAFFDEVIYGSFEHLVNLSPSLKIGLNVDKTSAEPGHSLSHLKVESRANSAGLNLYYQALRQRQHNLSLSFGFDGKNTNTTLLGSQISHDQIRAFRAGASYDFFDDWSGYNAINLRFSQGINGLDSSNAGDANLTRANAKPDFRKVEIGLQKQQLLYQDLLLFAATSMQAASGTLYSSEQFGYGGQSFGRAYDSSDIVGDHGLSGSIELRYKISSFSDFIDVTPYGFYDFGKVWVESPSSGEAKNLSGSSVGFGARFETDIGLSGNFGLAYPLTRDVTTPIYDHDKTAPRILLQVSKSF